MIWVSVGPTRHATFGSTLISIEARPPPISVEARPPLPIRRHVGDGWRGGPMKYAATAVGCSWFGFEHNLMGLQLNLA